MDNSIMLISGEAIDHYMSNFGFGGLASAALGIFGFGGSLGVGHAALRAHPSNRHRRLMFVGPLPRTCKDVG